MKKQLCSVSNRSVAPSAASPRFLTSAEVCALLRIDRRTLRRYTKKRLLSFVRRGGGYLFPSSEVERFIESRTVPSRAAVLADRKAA